MSMNKQIPPECPACPHPAHVGRCLVPLPNMPVPYDHRFGCQCPGPSDSAERPAFAMNNDSEWLRQKAEQEDGCDVSVGDPGPATVKCSWCGGTLQRIPSPEEPPCPVSPQELLLAVIESIVGDDFCEDLERRVAFEGGKLTATEKTAAEKLSVIYRLTHSAVTSHTCHSVHDDWRKEAADLVAQHMERKGA